MEFDKADETDCLGAVVLTLNATESLFGLCSRRTWETSWVKGPVDRTWSALLAYVIALVVDIRLKPSSDGSNSTDMIADS